jgi:hypothetical protein
MPNLAGTPCKIVAEPMALCSSFVPRGQASGPFSMPLPPAVALHSPTAAAAQPALSGVQPVSLYASLLPFVLPSPSPCHAQQWDEHAAVGVTLDTLRALRLTDGSWVSITAHDSSLTRAGQLRVVGYPADVIER